MVKKTSISQPANLQARIPILIFEEGRKFVAYSPALDLSTCGNNPEQARQRFIEAASLFLDEIKSMGTTFEVLTECGWHQNPGSQEWLPPKYHSCTEELITL